MPDNPKIYKPRKKSAASAAAAKVRGVLRLVRLRTGIYPKRRADIGSEHTFGSALAALAECKRFSKYVEIGTAHGLGSTKIIADILLARDDSCCLWTVEAVPFMHAVAVGNWRDTDLRGRVIFVHGAVAAGGMMTWDEVREHYPDKIDLPGYEHHKAIADNAPDAMPRLPEEIDVLLLDGGELYSYGEYRALEGRAQVICLDDIHNIKNRRVREEMLASDKWGLAAEDAEERNGWSVFCRREWQDTVASVCAPR